MSGVTQEYITTMNKIDKLISLVLSELEGGELITNKKPSEVSYYVDQTLIFTYEEYPYYISELGKFEIYDTLPTYEIIKNTLNEEDFRIFIEKFIISISPMLSDYLDMNKVKGYEIQDWIRTKTTVFLYGEN
jgi:hypothetical protein